MTTRELKKRMMEPRENKTHPSFKRCNLCGEELFLLDGVWTGHSGECLVSKEDE